MLKKTLLIVEPSTAGLELIPIAKRLGCFVMVLSANKDERVIPDQYKKDIDQLIVVDTNKIDEIRKVLFQLQATPDAVIPGFEIYVDIAAQVAAQLNLPHVHLKTAKALRHKGEMRDSLQKFGVRVPAFFKLHNQSDIDRYANQFDFPMVIKPIDQSGSVHVSKVENLSELKSAYQKLCADTWTEMNKGIGTAAIVESYIEGQEYSVEGYIDQGDMCIVSITEKTTTKPPYFVEMQHVVSADLTINEKEKIISYMQSVINALALNLGVFHAEIKVDNQGPVLIEIAGRLAGDHICDLIKLARGVDLREAMIYAHLNLPMPARAKNSLKCAGIVYFESKLPQYQQLLGVDKIKRFADFYDFQLYYTPSETIPPLTSFLGRVGYAMAVSDNYQSLVNTLSEIKSTVSFI